MPATPADLAPEVTVWADAHGAAAALSALDRMGSAVKVIGVGGPRTGDVDELARALDCPRDDDLRRLLVDRPATFLLLTTMTQVTPADLLAAIGQGTLVLALEPVAAELRDLVALGGAGRRGGPASGDGDGEAAVPGRIVAIPSFEQSPGYRSAAEPFEAIGERRTVHCQSFGGRGEGSLFARLLDAWRTVLAFTALPVVVDASLSAALSEPPEGLRDLTGALTAHARMGDGSSAVLHVADRAAGAQRSLIVLGPDGQLRVDDVSYQLRQADGEVLDEDRPESGASFGDLVAWQWHRLIDRLGGPAGDDAPPQREAEALVCCLACLLSIRTGQPESPPKLLQMGR